MNRVPILLLVGVAATVGCSSDAPSTKSATQRDTAAQTITTKEVPSVTNQWPFQDSEDTAVITLTRIMDRSNPILYVVHDEDGDWQFLDGGDVSEEDSAISSLKNVAELDPTIRSLADLPIGWAAERAAVDQKWERSKR